MKAAGTGSSDDPGLGGPPPEDDTLLRRVFEARVEARVLGGEPALPRIDRFVLERVLGAGGMGTVWLALDEALDRRVALKLVRGGGAAAGERMRLREARALARIAHPNVIGVHDVGEHEGRVWLAMEYVPGRTLRECAADFGRTKVLEHWIAAGRGLAAIHAAGLVHRDVKPDNVLLGDDGRVRVIDLGLARTAVARTPEVAMTMGFVGTRAYAAPEQLRGESFEASADQFAYSVSILECLRAAPAPVGGEHEPLSAAIVEVLARARRDDPAQRFASVTELVDALEAAARSCGPGAAVADTVASPRAEQLEVTRTSGAGQHFDDERPALQVLAESGRIGRFMVLRELGRGATGVVFAAYDQELDRKVAIKLLHAGNGGGGSSSSDRNLLLREAQALARLAHPNVVAVYEVGVLAGSVFVAMEYVAGVDLQQWLAAASRPWREVVAVMRQAGAGLVAAHREGMVHRDFKPSNVLVGDDGRVRVADFGLAALRRPQNDVESPNSAAPANMAATLAVPGALIGTPVYMAPELLLSREPATAQSDQYAYCVALYEAVYGARPYDADTLAELMEQVERRALPATPPRADVPAWLHAAVMKGLARAPEQRFATLAELVELLARDPEAEQAQRRRRALQIAGAIAATAALVGLLVLAWGALRDYALAQQADQRLAALRQQIAELRERGEAVEASKLLAAFVAMPDNRGVSGRAHLEWAAAQTDPAAAVDAYASAYIAAGTPAEGHTALRGLVVGLQAQGKVTEAARALGVLEAEAPAEAEAPEMRAVRLSAGLARRDLAAARAALTVADEDGWSPVLEHLSQTTDVSAQLHGTHGRQELLDFDGDGVLDVVSWRVGFGLEPRRELRVSRADAGLTPVRTLTIGPVQEVHVLGAVLPGEPLLITVHEGTRRDWFTLKLVTVDASGTTRTLHTWEDSRIVEPRTVDLDGDGRREVYVGTNAYGRKLWRFDREADGTWTRREAHPATNRTGSDITSVMSADLDGDGRPELVAGAGAWRAYDLRIYKPGPDRELELVARRALGVVTHAKPVRMGARTLLALIKADMNLAPGRFPADRPRGEPSGLLVVELRGGSIEIVARLPGVQDSPVLPGDLDGDGDDELIFHTHDGMALARMREGSLRSISISGVYPRLVHDLDGDGRAEIVAVLLDRPEQMLVLGAGDEPLPPLPPVETDVRAVPDGIEDPVIATAWRHAEQLVAIGLPRRSADELSSIARLSGQVAPDMLYRTGELFAVLGAHAEAAEHFQAAATRPDIAGRALAGAAAARSRLGEFAAAAELTRQRAEVVGPDARAAVEAEAAALAQAAAPRTKLELTFSRPLDERWRVHDPVAVKRSLDAGTLSVWSSPMPVLAELPLVWDGGSVAFEVELENHRAEWGTVFDIRLATTDTTWLYMRVWGNGQLSRVTPEIQHTRGDDGYGARVLTDPRAKVRLEVYPAFDVMISVFESDGQRIREAWPKHDAGRLTGPVQLQLLSDTVMPGYTSHVSIRRIVLEGFTPGTTTLPDDAVARRLVEQDFAGAARALASAPSGSVEQVWHIDALLGLGQVAEAAREMTDLLAVESPSGLGNIEQASPVLRALFERLRRGDQAAWLAAQRTFGPRVVELVNSPGSTFEPRAADVGAALVVLPESWPEPTDAEALRWQALSRHARGSAHLQAGQLTAARAEFDATSELLARGVEFPERDALRTKLLNQRITLAVASDDRAGALSWIRELLKADANPDLALEWLQARAELDRLLGSTAWAELAREIE